MADSELVPSDGVNQKSTLSRAIDAYTRVGTVLSVILAPLMLHAYWLKLKETVVGIREHPSDFACFLGVFTILFALLMRRKGFSLGVLCSFWKSRVIGRKQERLTTRHPRVVLGVIGAAALAFVTAILLVVSVTPKYYVLAATLSSREAADTEAKRLERAVDESLIMALRPVRTSPSSQKGKHSYIVTIGGPHDTRQSAEATLTLAKQHVAPFIHASAYVQRRGRIPLRDRLDVAWRTIIPLRRAPSESAAAAPDSGNTPAVPEAPNQNPSQR
jgi:hypothetical protein